MTRLPSARAGTAGRRENGSMSTPLLSSGRDAVIVAARRTAVGIGKPERGIFSGIHPVDLSTHPLRAVLDDTR